MRPWTAITSPGVQVATASISRVSFCPVLTFFSETLALEINFCAASMWSVALTKLIASGL
ncbi:MAG: hypothetical protein HC846_08340 [Blastocatellia bacterium]|nr:hypothetical protein [Blastocatellia bacterium]